MITLTGAAVSDTWTMGESWRRRRTVRLRVDGACVAGATGVLAVRSVGQGRPHDLQPRVRFRPATVPRHLRGVVITGSALRDCAADGRRGHRQHCSTSPIHAFRTSCYVRRRLPANYGADYRIPLSFTATTRAEALERALAGHRHAVVLGVSVRPRLHRRGLVLAQALKRLRERTDTAAGKAAAVATALLRRGFRRPCGRICAHAARPAADIAKGCCRDWWQTISGASAFELVNKSTATFFSQALRPVRVGRIRRQP